MEVHGVCGVHRSSHSGVWVFCGYSVGCVWVLCWGVIGACVWVMDMWRCGPPGPDMGCRGARTKHND